MDGNVSIINDFEMPQLNTKRRLWVYIPPDYKSVEAANKRYPVLYMNDGQNLFDASASSFGTWFVDAILNTLFQEGKCSGLIVVGIDHGGDARFNEYCPWPTPKGGGRGDAYCDFIVNTLKPYIDANYRTIGDVSSTGIGGASLGAIISLYAVLKYPNVFSKALCFSPSFWFCRENFLNLIGSLDSSVYRNSRIYMDVGTDEQPIPQEYVNHALEVKDLLWNRDIKNVRLVIDVINRIHHETSWAKRFPDAYMWLYKN